MRSEKDIMFEYIKQNDWLFYNSLNSLEKMLYLMKLEKTLYVLRSRMCELFELIIGGLKWRKKK